jgi:uncharacterized protein (DUF305 family)
VPPLTFVTVVAGIAGMAIGGSVMNMRERTLGVIVAALTVTLALVACGGQKGEITGQPTATVTGPSASQIFNDVDVTFAQQMIMHHQQAIAMATIAQSRAQDPQVKQLAATIEAEQGPQIQTMTGWLQAWGKPVPTWTPGMTPPQMPAPTMTPQMPTMNPQPDMSQMMSMSGTQFDRTFLQMMITHHQAAVAMARVEQAQGANSEARQLAKNIDTSQTAQIAQMQQMLGMPSPTRS